MSLDQSQIRAPLVVTMGDPCGIGPEIVARLFCDDTDHLQAGYGRGSFVLGDVGVMRKAASIFGSEAAVRPIATPEAAAASPLGSIPVLQVTGLDRGLAQLAWGQVHADAGAAAAEAARHAPA